MNNFGTKFKFSIDRGGTFTDVYCEMTKDGAASIVTYKLLSSDPKNYKDAPAEAIRRILNSHLSMSLGLDDKIPSDCIDSIRMGTTIATNAILERKGERSALLVTKGFKDICQIGNQTRPNIFALRIQNLLPLYEKVVEVNERVIIDKNGSELGATGERFSVEKSLDTDEMSVILKELKDEGFESIAVAFVHSYSFFQHELKVKELAENIGIKHISLSHKLMSLVKFYPRASTAVVDSYLTPAISKYISNFLEYFDSPPKVLFMQSDGGLTDYTNFTGSKAIISGPAGGVVGYSLATRRDTDMPVIGLDMGGTSTDVSRYDQDWEHRMENEINRIPINSPQLAVETVAAGGGSRLFYENNMFRIGPESAGADPGPICYRKNGYLAITDANLVLGRIIPALFPKIFGKNADQSLDEEAARDAIKTISDKIGNFSIEKTALGFIEVANEAMCRPILNITQSKGFDPKTHVLSIFGGAGGQHCCGIARNLKIKTVYIHKYSGILSAYGLSVSSIIEEATQAINRSYSDDALSFCRQILDDNYNDCYSRIEGNLSDSFKLVRQNYLFMKFEGNEYDTLVEEPLNGDFKETFLQLFKREFGFLLEKADILITSARVKLSLVPLETASVLPNTNKNAEPIMEHNTVFEIKGEPIYIKTPVYLLDQIAVNQLIEGPAIIMSGSSTILVDPKCTAELSCNENLVITVDVDDTQSVEISKDPISLALFGNKFMSIAEQMGKDLQRTAVSVNIKERLDFSCALFDESGNLVANAPHLPVHLGAMQEAVKSQIALYNGCVPEGTSILSNHPEMGGSHLPDLTVISPVYIDGKAAFYVANRGHHSDIGGLTPGSMPPFSKTIYEEGVAIKSFNLVENGILREEELVKLFTTDMEAKGVNGTRRLSDNLSDLKAQLASNNKGDKLLKQLCCQFGLDVVKAYMQFIQEAAEEAVKSMLKEFCSLHNIQSGEKVTEEDFMDDGSVVKLSVTIDTEKAEALFDFEGTGEQVMSNINAPKAVVYSAIIYCMRCLVNMEIPLNQGCMKPIKVNIPKSSLLWPDFEAAVVGGNVLTSQRITDLVMRVFSALANSQGCMNNLTFGNEKVTYYETIGGGTGAGNGFDGKNGVQVHMTNTRITDVEVIERKFPVIVQQFAYRENSGGKGKFKGGNGLVREFRFREALQLSILSERRVFAPKGLAGGQDGKRGKNVLIKKDGSIYNVGGKASIVMQQGDVFRVETPGGGGFGYEY